MHPLTALLSSNYAIAGVDPAFAVGTRAHLTYALPSRKAGFARVNPSGPDPADYLLYAKADLVSGSPQSAMNALSNAKRAVHQAVEAVLRLYALHHASDRLNFPGRLALLAEVGAFPTGLVGWLNRKRNLLEHEYADATLEEATQATEIAELFLISAYVFLGGAVVGAYVGRLQEATCQEYVVDPIKATASVFQVPTSATVEVGGVSVHVNIPKDAPRELQRVIVLEHGNKADWLPVLDVLAYCTRRLALRSNLTGPPGALCLARVSVEYPPGSGLPQPPTPKNGA